MSKDEPFDIFVIGGGINGAGVARDAAGRGLRVCLAEMNDFASATSSASTKLFHGGLRYLEYFEVGLVKKALIEREILLKAMPHISWPMRFVLPYHQDMRFENETPASRVLNWVMPWAKGRRPAWMIRIGLFMYDHLGGREILPGTRTINLKNDPVGKPLKPKFHKAFEYSDCWVEDSRLVILNVRDAEERGAKVLVRTKVVSAERDGDLWKITTEGEAGQRVYFARCIVNAGGPWVEEIVTGVSRLNAEAQIRLVRGSHIVTRKLFDHDKSYFFQGEDGRIIFAIPYETDFTLIGTTDAEHMDLHAAPVCTDEERDYLLAFASGYFETPVTKEDIVWTYSGVRPLYDDGASSASAATRDYVLTLNTQTGLPLLNIFGGKITTYRKLAEQVMAKLGEVFPSQGSEWTAGVTLPGGNFEVAEFDALVGELETKYPFLTDFWARRMVRAYGREAWEILGDAMVLEQLGQDFGATLTAREVEWLIEREYARTAEDILWRRSKLGLRMKSEEIGALEAWLGQRAAA